VEDLRAVVAGLRRLDKEGNLVGIGQARYRSS
jgi:hypothetical protein